VGEEEHTPIGGVEGIKELWVHALGAKVGGGATYLRAVVPEMIAQLEGQDVRLVLLVPEGVAFLDAPAWVSVRPCPRVAGNMLARIVFDQVMLPARLLWRRRAALYCSGNFASILKPIPTVVLVRNAIYFEREFLDREWWGRRIFLRLQALLIRLGARGCARTHYPSRYMLETFEGAERPSIDRGRVNYYGIGKAFLDEAPHSLSVKARGAPYRFLLVMNYTLQKNLGFVLSALAKAKAEGLQVRVTVTSKLTNGPRATRRRDHNFITTWRLVESGHLELAGPQYGRDLIDLYQASDACLMPSFCESFAHPLVEAMAMGKPLICADRPYAHEICGDSALYVDPDRPEELVQLWRDWPTPLERARQRSREELLGTFSWTTHVSRLLQDLGVRPT
jgi:glycosyltransferase involved in cell wall biosynthesis